MNAILKAIVSLTFLVISLEPSHAQKLEFYLDSIASMERPIDFTQYLGELVTVNFTLANSVGLAASSLWQLQGQVPQFVLPLEKCLPAPSMTLSFLLTETLEDSHKEEFEFGRILLLNKTQGDFHVSETFTSGQYGRLEYDDIIEAARPLAEQHGVSGHPFELIFIHTHPSHFPFGTSDQSALNSLVRSLTNHYQLQIVSAIGIAISSGDGNPKELCFRHQLLSHL